MQAEEHTTAAAAAAAAAVRAKQGAGTKGSERDTNAALLDWLDRAGRGVLGAAEVEAAVDAERERLVRETTREIGNERETARGREKGREATSKQVCGRERETERESD